MMSIEGAGELNPIARVTPTVVARSSAGPAPDRVPIVLRATQSEARGARARVGGLRVFERAIRQLARVRDAHVVIATDGSLPMPRSLPINMEIREIDGDADAAIDRLRAELGPDTMVIPADGVWLHASRPDRATRVTDAASRRRAEEQVYAEAGRSVVGLVDRAINHRVGTWLTRMLFAQLPVTPALITLLAGFVGLYGALMVAGGSWTNVVLGFAILQASMLLDGCAGELARIRLRQSALAAWLDTMVGDFVNIVLILAVGLALWRRGGTVLDMKIALVSAALALFYAVITYRELIRQREGDVMKLRWWFAYGQSLRAVSGAGASQIKAVILLGRRDVIVVLGLVLGYFDQLPVVALYLLIVSLVRAAGALGQLLSPDWRTRPPA
jgi:phosphatidylglycerophosphate synthase